MATLLQRIENIASVVDERIERERKAKELKKMVEKFVLVNEELTNIVWACRFVLGISRDSELQSLFEKVRDNYEVLRGPLVALWGESPEKISILEPAEFYEPLEGIVKVCQEVETKVQEILREKMGQVRATYALAESLSIIPDIKINFQCFKEAINFLSDVGSSASSIAEFVGRDRKLCEREIRRWNSISAKLAGEQEKLDLQNVKGKKLLRKTLNFLNQFVKNNGEANFESLSGDIVDELKSKFPELSKKLKVSVS
jgi:hypothetical protein